MFNPEIVSRYYYLPLKYNRDLVMSAEDIPDIVEYYTDRTIFLNEDMLKVLRKRSDFSFMINKYYYMSEIRKVLATSDKIERIKSIIILGEYPEKSYFKFSYLEKRALKRVFAYLKYNAKIDEKILSIIEYLLEYSSLPKSTKNVLDFIHRDFLKMYLNPEKTSFQKAVFDIS